MDSLLEKIENLLKKPSYQTLLSRGWVGVEREAIRTNQKTGKMATTGHPTDFGNKADHKYITCDFAEAQVEFGTDPHSDEKKAIDQLKNLASAAIPTLEKQGEMFWPSVTPPPYDGRPQVAQFEGVAHDRTVYREYLREKYGYDIQLLCGIHVNVSFDDALFERLSKEIGCSASEAKNEVYLKIARNFLQHRWLLIYLSSCAGRWNQGDYENEMSKRNSRSGYTNKSILTPDFSSAAAYVQSIKNFVAKSGLYSDHEFYYPIRLKGRPNGSKTTLDVLSQIGIEYIELRLFDINPMAPVGINEKEVALARLFLTTLLLLPESLSPSASEMKIWDGNALKVACEGLAEHVCLHKKGGGACHDPKELAAPLLALFETAAKGIYKANPYVQEALQYAKSAFQDRTKLLAYSVRANYLKEGEGLYSRLAKEYHDYFLKNQFLSFGLEDLELSTQIVIKEGLKRSVSSRFLSREDQIVQFSRHETQALVKNATLTEKDSMMSYFVMENKQATHELFNASGVFSPQFRAFHCEKEALRAYDELVGQPIVIKSNDTNFGLGITIFPDGKFSQDDYKKAVKLSFSLDKHTVLIEDYLAGPEYRFLVIGEKVISVIFRDGANVVGDGVHSVSELVDIKNDSPLRGTLYRTPLIKILKGETETDLLTRSGKTWESIPAEGEKVYLRSTSNVSTGGDSYEVLPQVTDPYKELALKAARAVSAHVCGVDIIVQDFSAEPTPANCGVIEANFNPAIQMHHFPAFGKGVNCAAAVMDLIGFPTP